MGHEHSSGHTRERVFLVVITLAFSIASGPAVARAFTEHTSVTDDCHEQMTLAALDRAGWPLGRTPPEPTQLDRAVAGDLPFPLARERRDPWTVAMLIAVRHPDLAGFDPTDLPALAQLAARPENQSAHCLRSPTDDGPEGDASALASCRVRIRAEVERAIGEGDAIDLEATETFEVWLTFRGNIPLPFPRFAFRLGLALHILQDAFSHSFRDPVEGHVRHVVNYVDPLHRGYSEERDGHSHASALDQCRGGPESRTRRVAWAKEASADLLSAVAQHASNRDERLARVDDVLDRWLARVPGCDRSNRYCSAPELAEISSGCAAGGPGGPAGPDLALFAGLAVLLFARRRWPSVVIVALGSLLSTSVAAADDASATDERVRALALQPDVQEVVEVNRDEDEATVVSVEQRELSGGVAIERGLGVQAHAFGGMDKGVLGLGVGPRLDVIPWMIFGLDVEYASWISLATGDIARGVFNAAIVADFVYGKIGSVELRGHLALGCSVLLFDLAAADKGSTGPFAGFSILGIAIRASRSLRVVVEPAGLYFSVPQLRGFPLVHRHHRFMVALHYTP